MVDPSTAIVLIMLFGFGFQAVALPVLVSRAAMRFLDCPPILEKVPPA
jgi:hypothetical protein